MDQENQIQLWKSANQGDRAALAELLRSCQDQIYRFCLSQLRDENMAIDATQETASRLIQRIDSFDGSSRFSTWILGFALNVCREARRKQTKEELLNTSQLQDTLSAATESERTLEREEERRQLADAIRSLSDRQHQAIVLRYFESLPLAEVAAVMKVEVGTVKATINHALKNLKSMLSQ